MSEQTVIEPKAPAKPRKRRTRHTGPRQPKPIPAEFAGMTEFDCCTACTADRTKAVAAQQRLNEIESAYPRQASRDPRSQTVMESDREYLARNAHIADEFRRMTAALSGKCCISGAATCAHPFKGGLQPSLANPETSARYERAKKALKDRKIDLTKSGVA